MADNSTRKIPSGLTALKCIVEGTSMHTGKEFFKALVKNLAISLDAHGVWVAEYLLETNKLNSLAFWMKDHFVEKYEYCVSGTPCEPALKSNGLYHVPDNIIELFPGDYNDLKAFEAVSYLGFPLKDEDGSILGHLALLDQKPMEEIPEAFSIFKIFAVRAEAELRRIKKENQLRESEIKLNRLVNGTMDGVIEFTEDLIITQVNQAVGKSYEKKTDYFFGKKLNEFLEAESLEKVIIQVNHLLNQPDQFSSTFIQGHISCIKGPNTAFLAESTLSRYESNGKTYFAIFIRNVEEQVRDQQELKKLNVETVMLREKIKELGQNELLGTSQQLEIVKSAIKQVAPTDTTVLVRGETGTGKELIARAVHNSSKRADKPMLILNCAALPSELVESELFGHVKGAFTGAAMEREGRFALADNGTIFLDEIGELPLSLQAKLLRVLQEGEFEKVGSSKTQKVNVRVIAATNRKLEDEVAKGIFREDLFYRLNVFPIYVPPLRERGNDCLILAEIFRDKFNRRYGKIAEPLNESQKKQILNYHWPGNVRELQNVIERSVITNSLDIVNIPNAFSTSQSNSSDSEDKILTEEEIIEFEKQNIIKALKLTNWKVSGKDGAAALLKIPTTTLNSRISKWKIEK